MNSPVKAWLVVHGIRENAGEIDVHSNKDDAEWSAEYDRNHNKPQAKVVPCLVVF